MCVKNFFGMLVVLTSVFCVSCVPVQTQKPKPKPVEIQKPKPESFQQAFVVKKSLGVSSAKELDGASVCLIAGSKEEIQVSDYFKKNGMAYEVVPVDNKNELTQMYEASRCDVMVIFSNANVYSNDKFLPFE